VLDHHTGEVLASSRLKTALSRMARKKTIAAL
jgi:hypothetical protein